MLKFICLVPKKNYIVLRKKIQDFAANTPDIVIICMGIVHFGMMKFSAYE